MNAPDLTKTQAQITYDRMVKEAQEEFDMMEVSDEDLAQMDQKNVLRAMYIMKEDIEHLSDTLSKIGMVAKGLVERIRACEVMLDLFMRTDPAMTKRIIEALPPEAQEQARELMDEAGLSFDSAKSQAKSDFRPGQYL